MLKKVVIAALVVLAASSAAFAQAPKVEVSALFGYSLADGVSGDPFLAGNGQVYDRVDPKDSMNFTLSGGFFVGPNAEVGFMWRRQPTTLEVSGTTTTELGDINIDGYHGYFAYNFGDAEAKVRPYVLAGLGATHYGGTTLHEGGRRDRDGRQQHSVLHHLGRRREDLPGAEGRLPGGHPVDAHLHQVGRRGLVVRSVVGLLRDRRRPVLEPVRVRRRRHVPLLASRRAGVPPRPMTRRIGRRRRYSSRPAVTLPGLR